MRHFIYGFGGLTAAAALACSSGGPSTNSSGSSGNAASGSAGGGASGSSETGLAASGTLGESGAGSGASSSTGTSGASGTINGAGTGSGSGTSNSTGASTSGSASGATSTGGMTEPDGGANDAADDAPATGDAGAGCAASGYTLCDDFETTAAGAAGSPWTIDTAGGYTVETITGMAHSGSHSVHVTAKGVSGHGYIVETKTFPATDFWGRAYLLLQAAPSGHEVFLAFDGNNNEQVRVLNDLGGGKIATNRRSDDQSKQSSQAYPMGTWACYEWHETPTELHVYFQGKELTDADETWTEATLSLLRIGFERFDTGTGGDIYIDDVAVNSAQIGCD